MYKLKFTGECDQTVFESNCRKQEFWYHSYYFDNGFTIQGDYNIGKDIEHYGFPEDMVGMRVLDIGTGGGWFSFYFEQRGAEVTTLDARGYCDFDVYGRYAYPSVESEKVTYDFINQEGKATYFSPVSKGFWIIRDLLNSKVKYINARVYDINPELFDGKLFDLVFMGALLLHLRDPIGALMSARSVCRNRLIATTPILQDKFCNNIPFPYMVLPWTHVDKISWWQPNLDCYKHWFLAAGFNNIDVSRSVILTSDKPMPSFDNPSIIRNPTQMLQIGDVRV